jgi:glycosyltransferase involved in cell wall biosynthesis
MTKPKVAFVVQRCGVEVNGGAEALCLSVARAMTTVWDVHIVTTCARDYATWENHYPAGIEIIDGVTVHRFPVDRKRNTRIFDDLSARIINRLDSAGETEQTRWMQEQGPFSTPLLAFLRDNVAEYEAFYFFTYLYATTYFGLPLVEGKAVLVSFAHDEWPIWLNMWESFFERPRHFIFSTPEERDFLRRRFPAATLEGAVVGVGIGLPGQPIPQRFTGRYGITNHYVLYLGRIDEAKNCSALIAYFDHFKRQIDREGSDLILILLGREAMPIPQRPWMRHLGFVDEQTKFDALAGCEALIMPSQLESLSLVLLEAWKVGRPVLVNEASDVLVGQTRRAQGGLWFSDRDEFGVALRTIVYDVGEALGDKGRAFVEANYTWPAVVEAYGRSLAHLRHTMTGKQHH